MARLSQLLQRAAGMMREANDPIGQIVVEKQLSDLKAKGVDADIELHDFLKKFWRSAETERRNAKNDSLIKLGAQYSKFDVSVPAMGNFSIDYDQSDAMIADLVMPVVPGDISRKFPKWDRRDASRQVNVQIGSDGKIPETSVSVSYPTYTEKSYGAQNKVDLNAIAQATPGLDLMLHHSRAVMGDLMMARELRVAAILMGSSNYATGCTSALSSTARWDVGPATSTADPVKDIAITAQTAAALAGPVNGLAASTPVLKYLRTHPKVIAAAGATAGARIVSYQELANLFGLQYIIEGKAKVDTAGNTGTASYGYVWGKGCALIRVKPGLSRNELSFAKTFRHTDLSFREEYDGRRGVRGIEWLIGTHEDAELVTASDAGYLLDTCIS
jgi:hypothetical protein